jgi:Rieske Fe-S protein
MLRGAAAAGLLGAGALGLAACGSGSTTGAGSATTSASGGAGSGGSGGSGSGGSGSGTELVKAAEVPVGGAKVVSAGGASYVVAQPTSGTFVAHTAKCTHMGCTVGVGSGLRLQCPCHGSQYDAATGAVEQGPAQRSLAAVPVTVRDGTVVLS